MWQTIGAFILAAFVAGSLTRGAALATEKGSVHLWVSDDHALPGEVITVNVKGQGASGRFGGEVSTFEVALLR